GSRRAVRAGSSESSPQRPGEVEDDQQVDEDAAGFPEAGADRELVELEGDEQRGGDHGQVLGPELVEPEADALDQLERAVAERGQPGDPQLVRVQVMQARDDAVEEALPRVDVDAADDPLGEMAEVGVQMEEQVGAGGEQQHPAQRALDRYQANDEPSARRVAGTHRES